MTLAVPILLTKKRQESIALTCPAHVKKPPGVSTWGLLHIQTLKLAFKPARELEGVGQQHQCHVALVRSTKSLVPVAVLAGHAGALAQGIVCIQAVAG